MTITLTIPAANGCPRRLVKSVRSMPHWRTHARRHAFDYRPGAAVSRFAHVFPRLLIDRREARPPICMITKLK